MRAIAQSSDNQLHRVLALRGFVHLVSLESERPAEETIKMLQQAIELALNVSEKKRVLSELAKIKGPAALEMAAAYLEDKALQQEAEAAVVKIAQSTAQSNPEQTEDALKKVIRTSENDSLRQQAQKIIDNIK